MIGDDREELFEEFSMGLKVITMSHMGKQMGKALFTEVAADISKFIDSFGAKYSLRDRKRPRFVVTSKKHAPEDIYVGFDRKNVLAWFRTGQMRVMGGKEENAR